MRAAAAQPGRLIDGRYRLQQPGSRAAPDQPWPGWDELLRRPVEVTEIVAVSQSPAAPRARGAARAAARLSHSAIARVFDVAEQDGSLWIVTEPVPGWPLDLIIGETGPLPPARAARLGRALAGALAAAHAAGVTHGALTPSQVLVSPERADQDRVVLAGFGKLAPGSGAGAREPDGGAAARPAADLHALGTVLFIAVEGCAPSGRRAGAGGPDGLPPRAPSAGPLGPVIAALLDPDPARRPTADDAMRRLDEAARSSRETPAALTATPPATARPAATGTPPATARPAATGTPPATARLTAAGPPPAIARPAATGTPPAIKGRPAATGSRPAIGSPAATGGPAAIPGRPDDETALQPATRLDLPVPVAGDAAAAFGQSGLPPAPDFASLRIPACGPPDPAAPGRPPGLAAPGQPRGPAAPRQRPARAAEAAVGGRARRRVWPIVIALPVAAALFAAGAALWLALAGSPAGAAAAARDHQAAAGSAARTTARWRGSTVATSGTAARGRGSTGGQSGATR